MNTRYQTTCRLSTSAGLTYIEVLLAVAVLAACLVPALDALRHSLTLFAIQETMSIDQYALVAKTEEILNENFTALDTAGAAAGNVTTPTSYSDLFTTSDGRQLTRNVYISPMDGDNADHDFNLLTGTDPGILYLKVTIADTPLSYETISARQ